MQLKRLRFGICGEFNKCLSKVVDSGVQIFYILTNFLSGCSTNYLWWAIQISNYYQIIYFFQLCQFYFIYFRTVFRNIYTYNCYVFIIYWPFYRSEMSPFVVTFLVLKSIIFLISIQATPTLTVYLLAYYFASLYFLPTWVFECKVCLSYTLGSVFFNSAYQPFERNGWSIPILMELLTQLGFYYLCCIISVPPLLLYCFLFGSIFFGLLWFL